MEKNIGQKDYYKMSYDELDKVALKGKSGNFVAVPENIICSNKHNLDVKRVSILAYLFAKTGIDESLLLSLQDIHNWLGKKIDKHIGRSTITSEIKSLLEYYRSIGILEYSDSLLYTSYINAKFYKEKVFEFENKENNKRFAKIYIDELESVIQYRTENKNAKFDNSVVLLIFSYLRMNTYQNNGLISDEDMSYPEAYNHYYKDIADELSISERMVSKAIDILEKQNLIYVENRSKVKYLDSKTHKEKYFTPTSIFCNTYKRVQIKGYTIQIAEGEEYYAAEVQKKIKSLEKFEKYRSK
ncbi:MAG: hypothetical protein NC548_63230 [Lachnospiraceae bacterium]|nr:hypothetical protein [Lachnospiraceae bacterium]MCM1233879.1 hypothetical protein [Ruminococcus flavefaciens]